jgi:hypothetical protein
VDDEATAPWDALEQLTFEAARSVAAINHALPTELIAKMTT